MFNFLAFAVSAVTKVTVEKDPFFLVQWVAVVLGYILNFIYGVASALFANNALGISIILLTIIARTLMLPMSIKSQKSMLMMRKLQPEITKINKKYGDSKDPEVLRKKNAETQVLYSENKVNPFSGCLPMLILLPIFYALNYLFRNAYLHIGDINAALEAVAAALRGTNDLLPALANSAGTPVLPIRYIVEPFLDVPTVVKNFKDGADLMNSEFLVRVLNGFKSVQWSELTSSLNARGLSETARVIQEQVNNKSVLETFLTVDLVETCGWRGGGLVLTLLSGLTTLLSSWLSMSLNSASMDKSQKTQQYIMLLAMPILITWMTANFAAGVALYWIVGNIYQAVQQFFITKYYDKHEDKIFPKAKAKATPKGA